MKVLDVIGVRVETPTNQPIVLLRERDGERYVPIWIGAAEATAIAYAQQGVVPPRPLTHDLLKSVIEDLGHRLSQVQIRTLTDGVFHAVMDRDGASSSIEPLASERRPSCKASRSAARSAIRATISSSRLLLKAPCPSNALNAARR